MEGEEEEEGLEQESSPPSLEFELGLDESFSSSESSSSCGVVELGRWAVVLVCGSLVYYHCAYRQSSLVSLVSDVLIVLVCSLAILGLLFRHINISVPVDPLEWQISQDTANGIAACLANTIGAAESVLRVAATGHDKRLFFKVVTTLYILSALGRFTSGATVAYAGLWLFCLYIFAQSFQSVNKFGCQFSRRDSMSGAPDAMQFLEDEEIILEEDLAEADLPLYEDIPVDELE